MTPREQAEQEASDLSRRPDPADRACAWCAGPIPRVARADAVCCSTRCRQARHRFTRAATSTVGGDVVGGRVRRLAYADPPYPGLSARYYADHSDYAGEVDHGELIASLSTYDGWALSTSARALPDVLALCPAGVRVAAWHCGPRVTRSWHPLSAWEPVLYVPARRLDPSRVATSDASSAAGSDRVTSSSTAGQASRPHRGDASDVAARRVDSLVHGVTAMTTLPGRVTGTKPAAFCGWLFSLLAALPGDDLDDLFPGSGAVTRAWHAYTNAGPAAAAQPLPPGEPHVSRTAARDTSSVGVT